MAAFRTKNFLYPRNILRIIEILLSILAFSLIASWKNHGLGYLSLNKDDYNIINNVNFFLGVSVLTFMAAIAMCILILFNSSFISPLMDLLINGILGVLLSLATIILCVALTEVSKSVPVQEANLSFSHFEIAVAVGFMCAVSLLGSTWYAFRIHIKRSELPLNMSRSNADLPEDIPT